MAILKMNDRAGAVFASIFGIGTALTANDLTDSLPLEMECGGVPTILYALYRTGNNLTLLFESSGHTIIGSAWPFGDVIVTNHTSGLSETHSVFNTLIDTAGRANATGVSSLAIADTDDFTFEIQGIPGGGGDCGEICEILDTVYCDTSAAALN